LATLVPRFALGIKESNRATLFPHPARPSNPMEVVLSARRVVVIDDVLDIRHINSARYDIRSD
jgi:hypothetical protein